MAASHDAASGIDESEKEQEAQTADNTSTGMNIQIFVDLDGVLADFDKGFRLATGMVS